VKKVPVEAEKRKKRECKWGGGGEYVRVRTCPVGGTKKDEILSVLNLESYRGVTLACVGKKKKNQQRKKSGAREKERKRKEKGDIKQTSRERAEKSQMTRCQKGGKNRRRVNRGEGRKHEKKRSGKKKTRKKRGNVLKPT